MHFIADHDSMTTPQAFIEFCHRNKLPFTPINLRDFTPVVRQVDLGIATDEVVYDASLLRILAERELEYRGVAVHYGVDIVAISKRGTTFNLLTSTNDKMTYDAVVNCSYSDINRLTHQLGFRVEVRQYEYTSIAIISLDWPRPTGVTILDGEFMTILPFGKTGNYLLYHVKHAVIERSDGQFLPATWRNKSESPFSRKDRASWFYDELLPDCVSFVPTLTRAKLEGYLEGPRMVLAKREDTDARPSIVDSPTPGYLTVFSGKVDHSVWVPNDVKQKLFARIGYL